MAVPSLKLKCFFISFYVKPVCCLRPVSKSYTTRDYIQIVFGTLICHQPSERTEQPLLAPVDSSLTSAKCYQSSLSIIHHSQTLLAIFNHNTIRTILEHFDHSARQNKRRLLINDGWCISTLNILQSYPISSVLGTAWSNLPHGPPKPLFDGSCRWLHAGEFALLLTL